MNHTNFFIDGATWLVNKNEGRFEDKEAHPDSKNLLKQLTLHKNHWYKTFTRSYIELLFSISSFFHLLIKYKSHLLKVLKKWFDNYEPVKLLFHGFRGKIFLIKWQANGKMDMK